MAISAAVAVGSAAAGLARAVADKAAAVRVGPGRDPASQLGPVVTREARDRIVSYVDSGERQGAEVLVDGRGLAVTSRRPEAAYPSGAGYHFPTAVERPDLRRGPS
jgi:malonate-semialdehyde dehydrogenase (acetylating)/methylmalonate-semialdehyde dehydrogenase